MAYYAGKTGFLNIAGAAQPLEEWSLELETEEVEFTNFESFGMKSVLGGIRGGTVSGSGVMDSVAGAAVLTSFSTTATSGTIIEVECGFVKTGTVGITVKAVLTSLTIGNNVKEKATFEFSGTLSNMDSATTIPVQAQNSPIVIA
jgi:acyl-coenzyme A thioesterase PaaI-like protein